MLWNGDSIIYSHRPQRRLFIGENMKIEIAKKWRKLEQDTKDALLLLLISGGLIGVSLVMEHQEDVRLDELCGQGRSQCIEIVGQMHCDTGAVCGREEKWVPKNPTRN